MDVHLAIKAARLRNVVLFGSQGMRAGEKAWDFLDELLTTFDEVPAAPPTPNMPQDVCDTTVQVMVEYCEVSVRDIIDRYRDCPVRAAPGGAADGRSSSVIDEAPRALAVRTSAPPEDVFISTAGTFKTIATEKNTRADVPPTASKNFNPPHIKNRSAADVPSDTPPIIQLSWVNWADVPKDMQLRDVENKVELTSLMATFVPGQKRARPHPCAGAQEEDEELLLGEDEITNLQMVGKIGPALQCEHGDNSGEYIMEVEVYQHPAKNALEEVNAVLQQDSVLGRVES
ncbi:hypothetical protein TI39_contig610g00007 [Zymoseptoria brevis]|uniref:Uncharacterized protein n=1 Tax=Zymoseptoria brevis TaxID=1047168 RepID=A0A0F4GGY9_9PEZI|nr:hypothetical protein TI39_contig610g00007 [Zymoseptoria brevis]